MDSKHHLPDDHEDHERTYTIVKGAADVCERMEIDIAKLCTNLSISKFQASILLRHYNWNFNQVYDAWFADDSGVSKEVGFLEKPKPVIDDDDEYVIICRVCVGSFSSDLITSAPCGHAFCGKCWGNYIRTSLEKCPPPPECLILRCPEPTCAVGVGDDIVDELASEEDKKKYYRHIQKSYLESNSMRSRCPACDTIIVLVGGDGKDFGVSCICSHVFCLNCSMETHRPVTCSTAADWVSKIVYGMEDWSSCGGPSSVNQHYNSEFDSFASENKNRKNKTSSRVSFVKDWSIHGYEGPSDGFAVKNLEGASKYKYYYDCWEAQELLRRTALEHLKDEQNEQIKRLSHGKSMRLSRFLTEAWQQIVECRQMLKWTCVYGYSLPEKEVAKRNLFEYQQKQAEDILARLVDCANKHKEMQIFENQLTTLAGVTKKHFDNLVMALENGLSEVISDTYSSSDVAASSSMNQLNISCSRLTLNASSAMEKAPTKLEANMKIPAESQWSCEFCTYLNRYFDYKCFLCQRLRGAWICGHCTFVNPRAATYSCQMCYGPKVA